MRTRSGCASALATCWVMPSGEVRDCGKGRPSVSCPGGEAVGGSNARVTRQVFQNAPRKIVSREKNGVKKIDLCIQFQFAKKTLGTELCGFGSNCSRPSSPMRLAETAKRGRASFSRNQKSAFSGLGRRRGGRQDRATPLS